MQYKEAEEVRIADLRPYEKNAKTHDEKQIKNIAKSIKDFGFTQPLVIDDAGTVIIGHGRLEAAKRLGMETAPCIRRDDLTEEQVKKLRILDNKLNESPWDVDLLAADIEGIDFNGYELDLDVPEEIEPITAEEDNFDVEFQPEPTIKPGEIWALGNHRLMCGDSTSAEDVEKLTGGGESGPSPHGSALQRGLRRRKRNENRKR